MQIVARVTTSSSDLSKLIKPLEALNYTIVQEDKQTIFVYRRDGNIDRLKSDIKGAKAAEKVSVSLKIVHGHTETTV